MPDHMHLVTLGLTGTSDTFEFVRIAKQRTSFEFKRRRHAMLWQPGWHDRIIRPRDGIADFVRYVVENPVRAGLVADPTDYPYTGSGTMSRDTLLHV